MSRNNDEIRMAEEIISVLPAGVARQFSLDRNTIRFAVRDEGLRLRTISFNRASLRRLLDDPAKAIKVEYLQRDLMQTTASEFRYPRPHVAPLGGRVWALPCNFATA